MGQAEVGLWTFVVPWVSVCSVAGNGMSARSLKDYPFYHPGRVLLFGARGIDRSKYSHAGWDKTNKKSPRVQLWNIHCTGLGIVRTIMFNPLYWLIELHSWAGKSSQQEWTIARVYAGDCHGPSDSDASKPLPHAGRLWDNITGASQSLISIPLRTGNCFAIVVGPSRDIYRNGHVNLPPPPALPAQTTADLANRVVE
jgi:hypothetical protein